MPRDARSPPRALAAALLAVAAPCAVAQQFVTSLTGLGGSPLGATPVGQPGTSTMQLQFLTNDPMAVCNGASPQLARCTDRCRRARGSCGSAAAARQLRRGSAHALRRIANPAQHPWRWSRPRHAVRCAAASAARWPSMSARQTKRISPPALHTAFTHLSRSSYSQTGRRLAIISRPAAAREQTSG